MDVVEPNGPKQSRAHDPVALESVLGQLVEGIYVYDLILGHNVYVNPRYQEITGYSLEDLNSMPATEFVELFHEGERDEVLEHMEQVASSADGEVFEVEYRFRIADGRWIWCSSRDCVLDRTPEGDVRRFVGYFTDISKRKHAEIALAHDQRRKDEFLAMLSHELRNPLAPIRSGVDLLQRSGTDSGTRNKVLMMMGRQLDHLIHLVDDLMEVSRLTRSTITLKKERVDLRASIYAAVAAVAAHFPEAKYDVEISVPQNPLFIEADRVRIEQVLTNLLDNARKYSDTDGRVWIEVIREATEIRLTIRDEGIGLSEDQLEKIFQLFHRGVVKGGGLGVGLTLARNLIELHDGELCARSRGLGLGSEFAVTLPIQPRTGAEPKCTTHDGASLQGLKILVVDDNQDAAKTLGLLLESLKAEALAVFDGEIAVGRVTEFGPDVLILDIGMPRMDGYAVAGKIRGMTLDKTPLLIAVTGWGKEQDKAKARQAGFDHHLTKPVCFDELSQILREHVRVIDREKH